MTRKVCLLTCFLLLLAAESRYFVSRAWAGILRLQGERAFLRNDHTSAWEDYGRAIAAGGDRETLQTDRVELLLFGLDQIWAGVRVQTALPPREAVRTAMDLAAERLREAPFNAYEWSLVSDVYFHRARLRRGEMSLDFSRLTEDPLDLLLPEEWLGVAALETAARLEPNNYIFQDLLADRFLQLGSVDQAAVYCERSVASYPSLGEHRYLMRPELETSLLEAAIRGFEESRKHDSMVPRGVSESDAGELLRRNGQTLRAVDFLRRGVALSPDVFEGHYYLGLATYTLHQYDEAIRELREASRCQPDNPTPHVHLGFSYMETGNLPAAIEQFGKAREKAPRELQYFQYLGEALEKDGQTGQAERQFVAAANVHPESVEAWGALLAFYTRHRDLRPLAEACTRLRTLKPDEPLYRDQCASLGLELR